MKQKVSKILALVLAVVMLLSVLQINVFAAVDFNNNATTDQYYQLISKKDWTLAPGIEETEVVLNNSEGTRRQVVHSVTVDMNNEYNMVIPGYKGMIPKEGNYGIEATSTQAKNAEALGYGNVVAATNAMLSWYDTAYYKEHPELIGEPLYYSILNGYYYENSQGPASFNKTYAVLVINYDNHPLTGEPRPADMPKVIMRSQTDPLTGWEQNAVGVWAFLVKPDANGNPVNQYQNVSESAKHLTGKASRTFVGIKADGTIVMSVSDGEQMPYSDGFSKYEMADYMIKMGCVYAANCDGGGSTTFVTERPGEDLKVNCSLSDGGERPTTNTLLVISNAPADGTFARANIETDYDYYTPGSTVKFNAFGTDAVGTKVDIPADAEWKIKEENMGTIKDGIFTSNGNTGTVTAQMFYENKVVGSHTINIAIPTELSFDQSVVTVPFGKTVTIPIKATIENGKYEIGLGANDVTFATTNEALGRFDGLNFVATDEENAPADITSTITATLNMGEYPTATAQLNLGKGSEVLWDFEDGQADIDEWNVINNRKGTHWDYDLNLSLADKTNGKVHDGNYSMRLETNGLHSKDSHSKQYAWIRLGVDGEALVLENAKRVGFWLYVPEDNIQCWVQGHYMYDSDANGSLDAMATVSMMESENVYRNVDESGWHYLSMDISQFKKIALKYSNQFDKDPSDGTSGEKGEFFLALVFHKATNNLLWANNGSINGNYTYYMDNFTVDYSEAVDDRENPVFGKVYLDGETELKKLDESDKRTFVTTTNNTLDLSVAVADATTIEDANGVAQPLYNTSGLNADTAKVYIDGVEVDSTFENGQMSANVKVADGFHRVKFEICDNMGNKSVVIRVIKVESGVDASTINVVPADATLDRIPFGSIYWMNLEATKIETIQKVETVIDLNNVNHWQLDNMEVAYGFTADYTINEETNTATITFTRTGDNYQTGKAVLAKLPVRILYFDTDIQVPGYTAETYWTTYPFWAQDMKMDVDMGKITYVAGYNSNVLNTFSNEEFHVDTEMYTSSDNMDKIYFAEHGTTHVHTTAAIADKAPTCEETGYIDRTFCEGCNSVVDWGTTVPATGHNFEIANGQMICDCGQVSNYTGLKLVNDKSYYVVNGKLTSGWIMIDNEWYLFDKTTFAGLDGEHYTDDAIKFNFDNGRVTEGTWAKTKSGIRYWYGPSYYKDTTPDPTSSKPFEIDGKTYLFNRYGYMQTGITRHYTGIITGGNKGESLMYDCGTDGVASLYTGAYGDYFYADGAMQRNYRLAKSSTGDYYFIDAGNKILKNTTVYLSSKYVSGHTYSDGTALPVGNYTFGADGKMEIKNGPIGDYFYVNNVRQNSYKLVQFDGDFYFIDAGQKLLFNTTVYLSEKYVNGFTYADGTPLPAAYYTFGADGKMEIKNGPIDGYFYVNNVRQKNYKLVEFDGDFYFIDAGQKLLFNTTVYLSEKYVNGFTYADGTPLPAAYYTFGADGKMVIKNGPVNGQIYINNILQKNYRLIEFEGDFYFIDAGHKYLVDTTVYLSSKYVDGYTYEDGTPLAAGYYTFNSEGKMVGLNGPVNGYFYRNGIRLTSYQLAKYDNEFYFIDAGNKILIDTKVYLSSKYVIGKTYDDGTMVEVGYHYFDETGKMVY